MIDAFMLVIWQIAGLVLFAASVGGIIGWLIGRGRRGRAAALQPTRTELAEQIPAGEPHAAQPLTGKVANTHYEYGAFDGAGIRTDRAGGAGVGGARGPRANIAPAGERRDADRYFAVQLPPMGPLPIDQADVGHDESDVPTILRQPGDTAEPQVGHGPPRGPANPAGQPAGTVPGPAAAQLARASGHRAARPTANQGAIDWAKAPDASQAHESDLPTILRPPDEVAGGRPGTAEPDGNSSRTATGQFDGTPIADGHDVMPETAVSSAGPDPVTAEPAGAAQPTGSEPESGAEPEPGPPAEPGPEPVSQQVAEAVVEQAAEQGTPAIDTPPADARQEQLPAVIDLVPPAGEDPPADAAVPATDDPARSAEPTGLPGDGQPGLAGDAVSAVSGVAETGMTGADTDAADRQADATLAGQPAAVRIAELEESLSRVELELARLETGALVAWDTTVPSLEGIIEGLRQENAELRATLVQTQDLAETRRLDLELLQRSRVGRSH